MCIRDREKDVKKIVIHYEDGTEKVIDKGFFCNMKEEDGSAVLEFQMCIRDRCISREVIVAGVRIKGRLPAWNAFYIREIYRRRGNTLP